MKCTCKYNERKYFFFASNIVSIKQWRRVGFWTGEARLNFAPWLAKSPNRPCIETCLDTSLEFLNKQRRPLPIWMSRHSRRGVSCKRMTSKTFAIICTCLCIPAFKSVVTIIVIEEGDTLLRHGTVSASCKLYLTCINNINPSCVLTYCLSFIHLALLLLDGRISFAATVLQNKLQQLW